MKMDKMYLWLVPRLLSGFIRHFTVDVIDAGYMSMFMRAINSQNERLVLQHMVFDKSEAK